MGGPGSGNPYRLGAKGTTNDYRSIDIRAWAREGRLTPGNTFGCWWSRGGAVTASIAVEVHALADHPRALMLILAYHYGRGGEVQEDVRQPVFLRWTPCHYGGERPWFSCPGCGHRAAVLYGAGHSFACRQCYDLAYQSTRKEAGDRSLAKAQAIRQRLGGSANMLDPFPPKPPRMHWRTYIRLYRAHARAEALYDLGFEMKLARFNAILT